MALKMKIGAGGIDGTARRGAWMCGELMNRNRLTASLAPTAGAATSGAPAAPMGRAGQPAGHGHAFGLKISAQADGTFSITNSRTGFSKTYAPRPGDQ